MPANRLAPIVLFVHRRPDHTRLVLEALKRNPEAAKSELVIYSDGPRDDAAAPAVESVRDLCRSVQGFGRLSVVERPGNLGLAASVLAGVSETCAKHGRVIVLEDDLVVSPHFLAYMNEALDRYAEEPRVLQVSGHLFPVAWTAPTDAAFLPMTTSWGWATWQRAWSQFKPDDTAWSQVAEDPVLLDRLDLGGAVSYSRMLEAQSRGEIDSWAIRWWLHVCRMEGLVLFPAKTMVLNIGFDGSGVHCLKGNSSNVEAFTFLPSRFPEVQPDRTLLYNLVQYFNVQNSIRNRMIQKIKSIFINNKINLTDDIFRSDPWNHLGKINKQRTKKNENIAH